MLALAPTDVRRPDRADGLAHQREVHQEHWQLLIPDIHVGCIDQAENSRIHQAIASNAGTFVRMAGHLESLLQSRVICGCGVRHLKDVLRFGPLRAQRDGAMRCRHQCQPQMDPKKQCFVPKTIVTEGREFRMYSNK